MRNLIIFILRQITCFSGDKKEDAQRILFLIPEGTETASVVWWSELLATDPEVRIRFPALPDFLSSRESGTGSTQPREYN
jgi:hypothetical protein